MESPTNILVTRVRQMILEYKELRKKNEALKADVEKLTQEVKELKEFQKMQQQEYDTLKTAKLLSIANPDIEAAKQRINNLQRSVAHCITLLTEDKENQE